MDESLKQSVDLLKWSIGNSHSLWTYLHLAILATVGGAWAIREKVGGLFPFIAIAVAYVVFAIGNAIVIAGNQKAASIAQEAILASLQTTPESDPLVKTLHAIKVIPECQVVFFHLVIDLIVVFAIVGIGISKFNRSAKE